MPTLIICEKPSQAKHLQQALGSSHGQILPCRGHLLRLEQPEETNPAWKSWNQDLLVPPKGRYGYVEDRESGKGVFIDAIRKAIKGATEVIIATDCDREGQGIGQSMAEYLGFKGVLKRAIFNAEDPVTLKKAFDNLEPNSAHEQTYQAFIARQQSDQIYNLTLTRVATSVLRERGTKGVIGIGRVKTATLGIICKREREILAFKPIEYYDIKILVKGSNEVELTHSPQDDKRITDRAVADVIAKAAEAYHGPITVAVERKRASPPNPPDLATLQQRANNMWDWTSKKTGEIAQELYEMLAITYPRADTRYLKEIMIGTMPALSDMLAKIPAYSALPIKAPIIRKGKDGVFSDKDLDGLSHHAIIPNLNCPGGLAAVTGRMNADQGKLFDLVARMLLASIGEDYIYDTTTMHVPVSVPSVNPTESLKFSTAGSVPVYRGWRAIDDSTPEKQTVLPAMTDGESVRTVKTTVKASKTKPPPRFSEASVIVQMKEAWRYCPDPVEQERLKAAKGIGTAATRDTIVLGLKRQNLVVQDGRNLVPTTAGLMIYDVLLDCAKSLVDPASTARMESMLDDILVGKTNADTVIDLIAKQARVMSQAIMRSPIRINLETATSTKKAATLAAKAATQSAKAAPTARPAATRTPAAKAGPSKTAAARGAAQAQIARVQQQTDDRLWLEIPSDTLAQRAAYDMRAKYDAATRRWWIPKTVDAGPFRAKGWVT
jgi:DNA topoisomerase-3